MFTNEHGFDETVTTIIDDSGEQEDILVHHDESGVCIRQWNDGDEDYETVIFTPKMFKEMYESLNHSEGVFLTKV